MTPDYARAAAAASETLIKYAISSAPVDPLPVLKKYPGVLVVSYQDFSDDVQQDRACLISMFGDNQDAFTTVYMVSGQPHYLVTYNARLPIYIIQRALARELGHIVLRHDGSLPEDVRNEEAKAFSHYFLIPRALIHAVRSAGLPVTPEILHNLTGCNDYCLSCLGRLPAVSVSPDLNRAVRDQFHRYVSEYLLFHRSAALHHAGAPADLGSYMEGYEE